MMKSEAEKIREYNSLEKNARMTKSMGTLTKLLCPLCVGEVNIARPVKRLAAVAS